MGLWNVSRRNSSSNGNSESETHISPSKSGPATPLSTMTSSSITIPSNKPISSFSESLKSSEPVFRNEKKEYLRKMEGASLGLLSILAQNVFSYPCSVVRRQCQVNGKSTSYHLTPLTLLPTMFNLQTRQGGACLWKGLGSSLSVLGLTIGAEEAIAEVLSLPKEINRHSGSKKMALHFLMKGMALTITAPFYASSFLETVESNMVCGKSGAFNFLKNGVSRLFSFNCGLQIPLWKLVLPTVGLGLAHYALSLIASGVVSESMESKMEGDKDDDNQLSLYIFYQKLVATFCGSLMADAILFPFETVLHRLILQGTKTIIDNADNGLELVSTLSRYDGFLDCYSTIVENEGFPGLYKGFGAVLLQYGLCIAIFTLTKFVLMHLLENKKKQLK